MGPWAIVVPAGHPWNLRQLLESLGQDSQRVVAVVSPSFEPDRFDRYGVRFVWDDTLGPFVFSRAVNLGLSVIPPEWDVIMTSDDVTFATIAGAQQLVDLARDLGGRALVHPCVEGNRFNHPELDPRGHPDLMRSPQPSPLPMICATLTAKIRAAVGPLDESFTGYGYEDHDYVRRAQLAGFEYFVYHGVKVLHEAQRSVYRWRKDFAQLMERNRARYYEKWNEWPQR